MAFSKVDIFYRRLLLTKYFVKGWGKPQDLKKLLKFKRKISLRGECSKLVPSQYPVIITKDLVGSNIRVIEGYFLSPFDIYFPDMLPEESKKAYFQILLPQKWRWKKFKPICLHMAGTGDHYFWRRRHLVAKPLLKEAGVGSIILENPFYGLRKPKTQIRSILHNVFDIFVMGGCLVMEAAVLFNWCLRNGLGPLGVTGISMGGHMACLAAASWPHPIVLVPCLSWSTASSAFTEGVMSRAINWELLRTQYEESDFYKSEVPTLLTKTICDGLYMRLENGPPNMYDKNIIKDFISSIWLEEKYWILRQLLDKERIIDLLHSHFIKDYLFRLFDLHSSDHLTRSLYKDAVLFMKLLMDEFTHLKNFPVPQDTSLIICVSAQNDGYVPRNGVSNIRTIWPGTEVRYLEAGHVSAFVLHQHTFREAIIDGFNSWTHVYTDRPA